MGSGQPVQQNCGMTIRMQSLLCVALVSFVAWNAGAKAIESDLAMHAKLIRDAGIKAE